jgi:hypothetical protein
MNYLYEALEKPTRLYIKQCPHCGLKYFGKSVRKDIDYYQGSGRRWKGHLKKYKVKPVHLWNSDWYYDTSITRFAIKFSKLNKIVESTTWANLKDEDGLDTFNFNLYNGSERHIENARKSMIKNRKAFSGTHTEKTRLLISEKNKGRIVSNETREKLSKNNFSKKDPEGQRIHARMAGSLSGIKNGKKTDEVKEKISNSLKGRKQTLEAKQNMSLAWQARKQKEQLRWIYSNKEMRSKMIPISSPLPDGWLEGRKIKFPR